MSQSPSVRLAPPGAGLPRVELFVGRILFFIGARFGSKHRFLARFDRERSLIRNLIGKHSAVELSTQVLIRRPAGLEDSSRQWSAYMTLDHLRIVHLEMARVLQALSREEFPEGVVSTAAVKPSINVTDRVVEEYESSCDKLVNTVNGIERFHTRTRHLHPWFGSMDAHQWVALASGHMAIHRVQISRILKGLPGK